MLKLTSVITGSVLVCLLGPGCADRTDLPPPMDHSAPLTQAPRSPDSSAPELVSRYLVLEGPAALTLIRGQGLDPAARRKLVTGQAAELRKAHAALRPHIEATGATIVAELALVANALHVIAPVDALPTLAKLPGVARVVRPTTVRPALPEALTLVGAPTLWDPETTGLLGEGVRIGIVDSGVDYTHATFGGPGLPDAFADNDPTLVEDGSFPTARVVGGWDFAGDDYDSLGLYGSIVPTPDADPLDCGGHGTLVASVAAGAGVTLDGATHEGVFDQTLLPDALRLLPGAAPRASLYAFKIFGCGGSSDLLLPALERAVDPNGDDDPSDRLDVLNLSLGAYFALAWDFEREAVANTTEAGTLVVAASGNDEHRAFSLGFPGSEPSALSVGLSLKRYEEKPYAALEVTAPPSVAARYPIDNPDNGPGVAAIGAFTGEALVGDPVLGCEPFTNAAALSGKIVITRRGTCAFSVKADHALAAGAVGLAIVDNAFSDYPNRSLGPNALPTFHLRLTDGDALIAAAPLSVTLGPTVTTVISYGPDFLAAMSSHGPTADRLLLKPDLAAPGWEISAAWSGSGSDLAYATGSSLSTPLVAGLAALLLEAHPELTPYEVKARLTSSADPMTGATGAPFPTAAAGTGRASGPRALATAVTATAVGEDGQAGVSFGSIVASSATSRTRSVVVHNHGDAPVQLALELEPATAWPGMSVTATPTTLTVPAGQEATFELRFAVDPAALPPAPAYQPYAEIMGLIPDPGPSGTRDSPALLHMAASGRVLLVPDGSEDPVAMVAYHGIARPGSELEVGSVSGCMNDTDGGIASLHLTGTAAPHDNATSVLELGTTTTSVALADPIEAPFDLVAAGAYVDPTAQKVFFGVVSAGDWSTPAQGFTSVIGVEIDIDFDGEADYLVLVESFVQPDASSPDVALRSTPFARILDLASGASPRVVEPLNGVEAAYPGGQFIDRPSFETHILLNRVAVLPVRFSSLGLNAARSRFAYRAVSDVSRLPSIIDQPRGAPADTTSWVELDVSAPRLALVGCHPGTPLCPEHEGPIDLRVSGSSAAPLPKLLVLHHANGEAPRHQVVDLASVTGLESDLAIAAPATASAVAGVETSATFTVTAAERRQDVRVAVTVADGTLIGLTSSQGSCATTSCGLGQLGAGASATVTATVLRGEPGTLDVAGFVTSVPACESNPGNDTATTRVTFAEGEPGPEPSPEPSPELAEPNPESQKASGGGCSSDAPPGGLLGLALMALSLVLWRRLRTHARRGQGIRPVGAR